MIAKTRPHTAGFVGLIEDSGQIVGVGTRPDAAHGWQDTPGQSTFIPYCIVHPLLGGTFDGSLGCPDTDAELLWQVTCVGQTVEQCEWVQDEVNEAVIGQTFAVTGRGIKRIAPDVPAGGARRDDTVQPPVFIATPRYRVTSVASP